MPDMFRNIWRVKSERVKRKEEKPKKKRFKLEFYFPDCGSAYSCICANDWNQCPCAPDLHGDRNVTIMLPDITKYRKRLKKVAGIFLNCVKERRQENSCNNTPEDCGSSCTNLIKDQERQPAPKYPPHIFMLNKLWNKIQDSTVKGFEHERHLYYQAQLHMQETFPLHSYTIFILFTDKPMPLLLSISSSMISDLMLQLKRIIFCPSFLSIQYTDIILYVILRFLHYMSVIIQSLQNCEQFQALCLELLDKYLDIEKLECVGQIRALFIAMWCRVVQGGAGSLIGTMALA